MILASSSPAGLGAQHLGIRIQVLHQARRQRIVQGVDIEYAVVDALLAFLFRELELELGVVVVQVAEQRIAVRVRGAIDVARTDLFEIRVTQRTDIVAKSNRCSRTEPG